MQSQNWTREEDLAVLYLKLRDNTQLKQSHPDVASLAEAMHRTVASIWMRKGNFDSLDSSIPGKGLSKAAQLTRYIWAEYETDPQRIYAEARKAYLSLTNP